MSSFIEEFYECVFEYYLLQLLYLILSFLFMHYYPYYPFNSNYLYPLDTMHLHSELTAIRHGHILREQSQLEYLSRMRLDREMDYSSEVFEKEMRIANMIDSNISHLMQQRQKLEERRMAEELRLKEELLRLQRDYAVSKQGGNQAEKIQMQKQGSKAKESNSQYDSLGGQILNIKPKNYTSNQEEEHFSLQKKEAQTLKKEYEPKKRDKIKSVARDISYNEAQSSLLSNSKANRRSSILKKSNYTHSPKLLKSKKVKFLQGSPQAQSSYCLNNSALKAANNNPKGQASKKIQNRLRVSSIVFRDSQYRNVKHEVAHLFNTYETECRLRREVKNHINGRDEIIQKYNLVAPQ